MFTLVDNPPMNEKDLLKKIAIAKAKPQEFEDLKPSELADLVLIVLEYAKNIQRAIEQGKIKGDKGDKGEDAYNPQPDKDYLSLQTAKREIEAILSSETSKIRSDVQKALSKLKNGKDGKDAVITEEHIKEAANLASKLIELPDFRALITQEPEAIRNSLELLQGDERLSVEAISGLDQIIEDLNKRISQSNNGGGGFPKKLKLLVDILNADTATSGQVLKANGDGTYTFANESGGGGSYTDEEAQDAVGSILTDSTEIDFTYDDSTPSITASIKSGSIDETKLDASVNASLDLADSASQPGHTHTESDITDLDHYDSTDFATDLATKTTDDLTEGSTNKYNATHTGDVTGDEALTIDPTAISGKDANAGLDGTEEVLINVGGTLEKTTTQDIANLGGTIDGSGSANKIAKFSDSDTIADSSIIDDGAYVGVGTTAPGATLPNTFVNHADSRLIQVSSASSSGDAGIFLRRADNAVGLDLWADSSSGSSYIDSRHNSNINFRINTNGTPKPIMSLAYAGGTNGVGIGTTTPTAKLEVVNDNASKPVLKATAAPSQSSQIAVIYASDGSTKALELTTTGLYVRGIASSGGELTISTNASGRGARFTHSANAFTFVGSMKWSPASVVPQITANQDDWSYGNYRGMIQRWTSDAARDITGIRWSGSFPAEGYEMFYAYNAGSFNITIKHEDSNSTAGYRFLCSTGADIVLAPNDLAQFIYDGTSSRWRVWKVN
jgi:hypothetical protein